MRQASRLGKSKIEDRVKNGLSSLEKTIRVTNTLPISTTSITNTCHYTRYLHASVPLNLIKPKNSNG
jgi:hypothetical protein